MILTTFIVSVALAADADIPPPPVVEASPPTITESPPPDMGPEEGVGGVFAPAVLPRGSMSVYALLGAPDIGGGYRQGFARAELEVRIWLNYLQASALVDIGGKMSVYRKGIVEFVPNLALGLEANSGSRYYDKANYGYVALRPRAGVITAIRFNDIATGLFIIDLPWAIALTNGGAGGRFSPTMGFGGEVQLGHTLSAMLLGQVGIDAIKEPLGVTQLRPAWAIRLGLGFRLFR